MIFSASLEFYLLCHLLKTEADQVVITVMEVFREEQSVRRVRARSRSNTDQLQMLWHESTAEQRNVISMVYNHCREFTITTISYYKSFIVNKHKSVYKSYFIIVLSGIPKQ